ncbi:unnamed protein product [Moneuplotes crassus]|uniref:GTP-binding protein n=1 Tax=Euplotes crassus TaxID=5936 RepID=A0AAD1UEW8_EUPCR|nr:unnamed protein product [Moneuplotes crassus]
MHTEYECMTLDCKRHPEFFCLAHEQFTCSQCNTSRHYECDSTRICQSLELEEISDLLYNFVDGLKNKAALYNLFKSIQRLEEALNDVVKMLQANVAQCFRQDKHEDISKLVFQGKQILSDIFEGTIFGNNTKSNPILRLLFDSQVLDTQNGYLIPPMGVIEALVNLKSKDLVRKLVKRTKKNFQDNREQELEIVRREVTQKLNNKYIPQIKNLESLVEKMLVDKQDDHERIQFLEGCLQNKADQLMEMQMAKLQIKDFELENATLVNQIEELQNWVLHHTDFKDSIISESNEIIQTSGIALLGDSEVGKTVLTSRIEEDVFLPHSEPTKSYAFRIATRNYNHSSVKIKILDTAGKNRAETLSVKFLNSAQYIFLMYDITSSQSLEGCQFWLNEIPPERIKDKIIYFIGNKADLKDQREVSLEVAAEFRASNGIDFHFEVSAKTGDGIDNLLQHVMKHLFVPRQFSLC